MIEWVLAALFAVAVVVGAVALRKYTNRVIADAEEEMERLTSPEAAEQFMRDLSWRCHACGAERPDPMISVATEDRTAQGVPFAISFRYCNDRPACREKAEAMARAEADRVAERMSSGSTDRHD